MKKLLSLLAAVGLTATASGSVVACTTSVAASNTTNDNGNITTKKSYKITIPATVKDPSQPEKPDPNNPWKPDPKVLDGGISKQFRIFFDDNSTSAEAKLVLNIDMKNIDKNSSDKSKGYPDSYQAGQAFEFIISFTAPADKNSKGTEYTTYLARVDKTGKKSGSNLITIHYIGSNSSTN